MHNYKKIYYFIDRFNFKDLSNIKKEVNIVYRNYQFYDPQDVIKTREFCKKRKFKLYLANNIRLAIRLNLDGVYLPAFNKISNYSNIKLKKKFTIIGSAHNIKELKIKESQNCKEIFISPIFRTEKSTKYLDVVKFNYLAKITSEKTICLGGINEKNIRRLRLTKSSGFASISWIKKNGLNKNLGRF